MENLGQIIKMTYVFIAPIFMRAGRMITLELEQLIVLKPCLYLRVLRVILFKRYIQKVVIKICLLKTFSKIIRQLIVQSRLALSMNKVVKTS